LFTMSARRMGTKSPSRTGGASSLIAAARSVRVLNPMTADEAQKAGVEVERKGYFFRSDIGKANLAPPSNKATWFSLKSVPIGNGTGFKFANDGTDFVELDTDGGDAVGVVIPWSWPEPLDGVCASDLKAAQAEIAKGRWKKSGQAADWVGIPIAVALKLDRSNKGDREKIKSLIAIWIKSGMLKVVIGKDGTRHDREFVEVGEWA